MGWSWSSSWTCQETKRVQVKTTEPVWMKPQLFEGQLKMRMMRLAKMILKG